MDNIQNKTIIVVQGLPGSGKSTFAKQWANEDSLHRVRISLDDIRRMLGTYWVPEREYLVKRIQTATLLGAMHAGYNIVLDNMNLCLNTIDVLTEQINAFNSTVGKTNILYRLELKFFDTPIDTCIARDAKRHGDNCIGEETIRAIAKRHEADLEHWRAYHAKYKL